VIPEDGRKGGLGSEDGWACAYVLHVRQTNKQAGRKVGRQAGRWCEGYSAGQCVPYRKQVDKQRSRDLRGWREGGGVGRKYYIGSVCEHSAVSAGPDILLSTFLPFFY